MQPLEIFESPTRMSDWADRQLPALAHPATAADDVGRGPTVRAFPEIGAWWDGFSLAHVHCLGWRQDFFEEVSEAELGPELRARLGPADGTKHLVLSEAAQVPQLHEKVHWLLSRSLLSQCFRLNMLNLWAAIRGACEGKEVKVGEAGGLTESRLRRPITVPILTTDKSIFGTTLRSLAEIKRLTDPVEEVFAVWGSLDLAVQHELISREYARDVLQPEYVRAYDSRIPGYRRLYSKFGRFADENGFLNALAACMVALTGLSPVATLKAVIRTVKRHLDQGQELEPETIIAMPQGARPRSLLGRAYREAAWLEVAVRMMSSTWSDEVSLGCWRDLPTTPFLCGFAAQGLRLHSHMALIRRAEESAGNWDLSDDSLLRVSDRPPAWFWVESLRQQLTQGDGLVCPFWDSSTCCGRSTLLDGLWRHTRKRRGWHGRWEASGCLRA